MRSYERFISNLNNIYISHTVLGSAYYLCYDCKYYMLTATSGATTSQLATETGSQTDQYINQSKIVKSKLYKLIMS